MIRKIIEFLTGGKKPPVPCPAENKPAPVPPSPAGRTITQSAIYKGRPVILVIDAYGNRSIRYRQNNEWKIVKEEELNGNYSTGF